MWNFVGGFFLLITCAHATLITTAQVSCDGATFMSTSSISCSSLTSATVGSSSVQVMSGTTAAGHFASASAVFQDDFVFTVTGGPAGGFFLPCFSAGQDYFQGSAQAVASFAGVSFSVPNRMFSSVCGLYGPMPVSFTRDVPQAFTESLTASVNVGSQFSNSAQGMASASLTGFSFFDSSLRPITDVTYSLVEVTAPAVPEPANAGLFVASLLVFAFLRRAGAASGGDDKIRPGIAF